jgi:hypothetical protein
MTDRIERVDRVPGAGTAVPVPAALRNARTDPDGSRRDHPQGENPDAPSRRPRPAAAAPDDGLPHVDVRA